jgi:hypothetical protein
VLFIATAATAARAAGTLRSLAEKELFTHWIDIAGFCSRRDLETAVHGESQPAGYDVTT